MPVRSEHGRVLTGVAWPIDSASAGKSQKWRKWTTFESYRLHADFFVLPVSDEQHAEPEGQGLHVPGTAEEARDFSPFTGSDLLFKSQAWISAVALQVSGWIGECLKDPSSPNVRTALAALCAQVQWAIHCNASAVYVPVPTGPPSQMSDILAPVASTLIEFVDCSHANADPRLCQVVAVVPSFYSYSDADNGQTKWSTGWVLWNELQKLLPNQCSLQLAVRLVNPMMIETEVPLLAQRWIAEPLHTVFCPHSWLESQAHRLILHASHREFILEAIQRGARAVLDYEHPPPVDDIGMKHFYQYIKHLWASLPPLNNDQRCRQGYRDVLQLPLQPLSHNLDAETYECFEADPVKYKLYHEALVKVISQRYHQTVATTDGNKKIHISYLGGGRGPLMATAISVIRRLDMPIEDFILTIVEKNPCAIKTLRARVRDDDDKYWRRVQVIQCDMRMWKPEVPIDILLSELLGSFGDNELSPECLDGVLEHLAPDAVSIPQQSTSWMEPVSCTRNFRTALTHADINAFVCEPWSSWMFTEERAQAVFTFEYPNRDPAIVRGSNEHNARYARLEFTAKEDAMCHGLAAYFSSVLAEGVHCSIAPHNHSPEMSSWFPFYFAIDNPVFLRKGQKFTVHMWRKTKDRKVWYEWILGGCRMQNSGGWGYTVGL